VGDPYFMTVMYIGNELPRPIEDGDAETMMGAELTISHGDVVAATGTVTSACVVSDRQMMEVVIERGGRRCPACAYVYTEAQALLGLRPLGRLQALMTLPETDIYRKIPPWVNVCSDPLTCRARVAQREAG
jgi:hypothetical protein